MNFFKFSYIKKYNINYYLKNDYLKLIIYFIKNLSIYTFYNFILY